ncbi:hypothetical protein N2605_17540 [Bradyrhizobium yuanmingense]|uniref:hypothetical protein n=1 Tax=Bradyrhizobium yuanmingense TaxID=108015 RepID=UPI0021A785CC|nr:hypothetical protein [Bradyrhizobium sp. CB1024]UWU88175.1 hypothetical protein N2605_17540 [Bradyrhizobium sp. CB1024]
MKPFNFERPATMIFELLHGVNVTSEDRGSFFASDQLTLLGDRSGLIGTASAQPFADDPSRIFHDDIQ